MDVLMESLTAIWPWLGPVLIVGLVIACAAVAIDIFSNIQDEIDNDLARKAKTQKAER